jgi:hypothetical protein
LAKKKTFKGKEIFTPGTEFTVLWSRIVHAGHQDEIDQARKVYLDYRQKYGQRKADELFQLTTDQHQVLSL